MTRLRPVHCLLVGVTLACITGGSLPAADTIGREALLPLPEGALYNRRVNTWPEDRATVEINPPRFSWFYAPEPTVADKRALAFRLQVAYADDFAAPVLDVRTKSNMYNMIAPFKDDTTCYWRVGYIDPAKDKDVFHWTRVRRFVVTKETPVWDRSMLAKREYLLSKKHPRLLLTKAALPAIRKLVAADPGSKRYWEWMKTSADSALNAKAGALMARINNAVYLGMAWQITQDQKYLQAKPQAMLVSAARDYLQKGLDRRDLRHGNEIRGLALAYDWLYESMTPEQRIAVRQAIEANCEFLVKHMWWKRNPTKGNWARANAGPYKGPFSVGGWSAAKGGESHQIDNFNNGMLGALAVYDESDIAMEFLHLGMNAMIAKPYPFGSDEALNEGIGYSSNIFTEVVNLAIFYHIAFPEAGFNRNPYFRKVGKWWRSVLPVGVKRYHAPWGHGGAGWGGPGRWGAWGRELALLSGDGASLSHWRAQAGGKTRRNYMYLGAALSHYFPEPKPVEDSGRARVFPREGWAMASTHPFGSRRCFPEGVGFIFQCRPRGAYSHAVWSDLSFQMWAYGQAITDSGGKRGNCQHSTHSMSHYSLLVDGVGQAQRGQRIPYFGRIFAFKEDPEGRYVYCAGDATHAYPRGPIKAGGWWGRLSSKVYSKGKGLPYLKRVRRHLLMVRGRYFVIFDELATDPNHLSRFSWLYHVLPDTLRIRDEGLAFNYTCGDVKVHVEHVADPTGLELIDLKGREGFKNPLTGEDTWREKGAKAREGKDLRAHALWVTNRKPRSTMHFMSVIYPVKPGDVPPTIRRVNDMTVEVTQGEERDVVTFGADMKDKATILVDLSLLQPLPTVDYVAEVKPQDASESASGTPFERDSEKNDE